MKALQDGSMILVTGANGFIGRKLAAALLAQGVTVHCMVRDPGSAPGSLRELESSGETC